MGAGFCCAKSDGAATRQRRSDVRPLEAPGKKRLLQERRDGGIKPPLQRLLGGSRIGECRSLALGQDGIEAGLKIVFSFAGQLAAFDRKRGFDGFHPAEQLLDVFPGLLVIQLQILGAGHPIPEGLFYWMIGIVERVLRGPRSQQAGVAGEKMFEAEVGDEMASRSGGAIVIFRALADELEGLRSVGPLQSIDAEGPKVPLRFDDEGCVWADLLGSESRDFGGAEMAVFQIPFRDGSLRGVNGLDGEELELAFPLGERRGRQESRELRNHGGFGEIARPDAQISTVCHRPEKNYTGQTALAANGAREWVLSSKL